MAITQLVLLWVNTREQPWPELPAISKDTWSLMLDDEKRIQSPFYRLFFVRTLVVSPNGEDVLNLEHGMTRRYTPEPDLYLQMLRASVSRHKTSDPGPQDAWRFLLI